MLRSAAIRNVHDVMIALGLGANGVCPYVMVEVICVDDYENDVANLCSALRKGIEKVISTIGIHEVRGYARQFSSIGIKPELAEIFHTEAFAASEKGGTGFAQTRRRHRRAAEDPRRRRGVEAGEDLPLLPQGLQGGDRDGERHRRLRRVLAEGARARGRRARSRCATSWACKEPDREPVDPSSVDASVGHHDYPVVISSMSFGSQSEPAFRAYAEAAKAINILCINGEGGEIQDMYGKLRKWRGQQVASGRFGVSAEMLNSSYVAEIKIGQGAKPGEGGHLPGKKVSEKVAAARNASPGTDLISPSNNHDLYSIEDLAELIDELKTVNPDLRVSVKVPVVPNIGTIGLGIAKAGADIITLSGFEGGTGAARQHALRHVGLPSDIGTRAVHRALMEAGHPQPGRDLGRRRLPPRPRHREAPLHGRQPGRLRHPGDGLARLHDLPRLPARHLPRRHRDPDRDRRAGPGARPEEVHAARRRAAAESCARFFQAMGEEVKEVVGSLGYDRAQDLVGRYDLLEQISHQEKIDLAPLITPLEEFLDLEPIDLPVEEEALVEARAEAGLVRAKPIRMEPKQASHEIAQVADKVFDGSCVSVEFPRRPTPTTASSAPSSRARSPAPGSTTARPRAPRTTSSPS